MMHTTPTVMHTHTSTRPWMLAPMTTWLSSWPGLQPSPALMTSELCSLSPPSLSGTCSWKTSSARCKPNPPAQLMDNNQAAGNLVSGGDAMPPMVRMQEEGRPGGLLTRHQRLPRSKSRAVDEADFQGSSSACTWWVT